MLPIHVTLRNFLSYGDPAVELDYTPFHVACVTGENGHGKSSAVVDAVTFALWGQARGTDARGAGLDDLMRLGSDEMEVVFSFELDGQVYRVLRKRWRGKATTLEFHARDGEAWRSLTAERIQDTQERINRVLRLDYSTFVHSAFVLQGKADSFTVARPGDRKQILAEVLGLKEYEEREALCRERALDCARRVEHLEREVAELTARAAEAPVVSEELAGLDTALARAAGELAAAREAAAACEARRSHLAAVQARMEDLRRRQAAGAGELAELEGLAARVEARMAEAGGLLAEAGEIEAGHAAWEEARINLERLAGLAQRYYVLCARRDQCAAAVEAEERRLGDEVERLRGEAARATEHAGRLDDARRRLADLDRALVGLASAKDARGRLEAELNACLRELAGLGAALAARQKERDGLRERYRQLLECEGAACCPVCRSPLDDERRAGLLDETKAEGTAAAADVESLRRATATAEAERDRLQRELAALQQELDREARLSAERAIAERATADAADAAERARELTARADALAGDLAAGRFADAARRERFAAEAELAGLAYDAAAHREAARREEELRPFRERLARLNMARQSLEKDRELLASYRQQAAARRETAAAEASLLASLVAEAQEMAAVQAELAAARERAAALEAEEKDLLARQAAARTRLEELAAADRRRREKEAERANAAREKAYWTELAQAYGRKGIQALIIENAIPELEQEANDLLARWTEGRLHLALITQGETRSGTVTETLDIAIADELGTRKYEMFSGGEKFRVDLALRVGLSKLLAKRAGARLRMLVVDEGFGTQDTAGIERLVEALNDLAGEFDKILIITHRPDLKDRFPTQIEVVKKPETGSEIRIASCE